jgi:hypothetical protein
VPKAVGLHKFNEVLQTYSNIVAIATLGDSERVNRSASNIEIQRESGWYNDNFVMDQQVTAAWNTPRRYC